MLRSRSASCNLAVPARTCCAGSGACHRGRASPRGSPPAASAEAAWGNRRESIGKQRSIGMRCSEVESSVPARIGYAFRGAALGSISGRLARSAPARADARNELRRRVRGEPRLPEGPLHRLLVLCHGNICRSPFAAVLLATRDSDPRGAIGRARSRRREPGGPDRREVRGAHRACRSPQHRSLRVDAELLAWADLILVMQGAHAAAIRARLAAIRQPGPPARRLPARPAPPAARPLGRARAGLRSRVRADRHCRRQPRGTARVAPVAPGKRSPEPSGFD